jgi:hypothetical protein
MKVRMGATHFLTKTLPKVATEMALSVMAYNLTRIMNIIGTKPLMAAIVAETEPVLASHTAFLGRFFYGQDPIATARGDLVARRRIEIACNEALQQIANEAGKSAEACGKPQESAEARELKT